VVKHSKQCVEINKNSVCLPCGSCVIN